MHDGWVTMASRAPRSARTEFLALAAGRVALGWPTPDKADDVRAQHFPAAAKKLLGFGQRPTFRKEAAGIALILLPQCGCRFDPRLGAQQLAIIERVFTSRPYGSP